MIKRRRLFWQIYPVYLIITIIALIAIVLYSADSFHTTYVEELESQLEAKARLLNGVIESSKNPSDLEQLCREAAIDAKARVTAISPKGDVLCDSEQFPSLMDNHISRPEILAAMAGERGVSIRTSATLAQDMIYVAIPIMLDGKIVRILRMSMPLTSISNVLMGIYFKIAIVGVILAIVVALINLVVTRRINRVVVDMKNGAGRFALGDFRYRLAIPNSDEMATLAESMNDMAEQLERIDQVRREFVANASHELRTPITAISGFINGLKAGAIEKPQDARHFMDIIGRHTERLKRLSGELLNLSRLENSGEMEILSVEDVKVSEILSAVVALCASRASERSIELKYKCDDGLVHRLDRVLIEEAMLNLVDNAINHSEEGSEVVLEAKRQDGAVVIDVIDSGCGISIEHHSRIFEKFYRADKARSRKFGGTGLGLSIAKHIVSLHRGQISMKSEPSKGSTFTISLPF